MSIIVVAVFTVVPVDVIVMTLQPVHFSVCVYIDMGSGLYGASKAIAISDLITTVTPEKRMEESSEVQGKKQFLWLILNQILNLSNYLRPCTNFSFFPMSP